jgi:NAD(P)-dependent dehydrogenase (short-subunit alcohol dehydrogenase family)
MMTIELVIRVVHSIAATASHCWTCEYKRKGGCSNESEVRHAFLLFVLETQTPSRWPACQVGTAPYNASKFGVVALSETLAAELAGTPIGVSVLCTAFVRARIATSSQNHPPRFGGAPDQASAANPQLEGLVQAGLDPNTVARRVVAAVRDNDC